MVPSYTASPGSHLRTSTGIFTFVELVADRSSTVRSYSVYTGAIPAFNHHIWTGIIEPGEITLEYSSRRKMNRYPIFLWKSSNFSFHSAGIGADLIFAVLTCQRSPCSRM